MASVNSTPVPEAEMPLSLDEIRRAYVLAASDARLLTISEVAEAVESSIRALGAFGVSVSAATVVRSLAPLTDYQAATLNAEISILSGTGADIDEYWPDAERWWPPDP